MLDAARYEHRHFARRVSSLNTSLNACAVFRRGDVKAEKVQDAKEIFITLDLGQFHVRPLKKESL